MTDDKTDFHPYITKLKAELLQFPKPANDPENILLAWKDAFSSLFEYTTALLEYTRTLDMRLVNVEDAVLQTAGTVKKQRPVLSSAGHLKGYWHSDGTVQKYPEDC